MVRNVLRSLKYLGIQPESAQPSVVAILALAPSIVAGMVFFRLIALEMLVVAAGAAIAAYAASRLRGEPLQTVPVLPALVGVAFIGAGASLAWAVVVAVVAVGLELARDRYTPGARLQTGLVAYSLVWLLARGGPATYVSPDSATPLAMPGFGVPHFAAGQGPIDPVRLYVGNVAGPVFATSTLAVAIGAAWFWYARRLSLLVVLTFLVGVTVPMMLAGWSPGYELLIGPVWFAAALLLADRRDLPRSTIGRPLVGFAAGAGAMWLRARGYAIESTIAAMAAVQVGVVAVQGVGWLMRNLGHVRARLHERRRPAEERPALPPAGPDLLRSVEVGPAADHELVSPRTDADHLYRREA